MHYCYGGSKFASHASQQLQMCIDHQNSKKAFWQQISSNVLAWALLTIENPLNPQAS